MSGSPSTTWQPRRNAGWTYEDRVDGAAAGWSAVDFYARHYPHSTAQQWRQRLDAGQVRRGSEVLTPEARLAPGDRLAYRRPPWTEPPAPRAFAVLYCADDLLAVAKPSGLQVLPAGGFLENTLLHVVRQKRGADWAPAHRLGRGTSGIVLFVRGDAVPRAVAAAFRDGGLRKLYRALVQGQPAADAFEVRQPIGRLPYPGMGSVHAAVDGGRPSHSRVRVLERRDDGTALVEVEIPTGRPHQIRIHLAAAGHPLVGEPLYVEGGRPRPPAGAVTPQEDLPRPGDLGYLLHAARVRLKHPVTGAAIDIRCRPPAPLRRSGEA